MRLAVNIEKPADLSALADYYHPTSQSISFVRNLAATALEGGGAHALMGAYGVGKSSLAAFALNELSCATQTFAPRSHPSVFGEEHNPVSQVVSAGGLASMPIVGAAEPLASRVTSAVKAFSRTFPVRGERFLAHERLALDPQTATGEQALTLLTDVARTVRRLGRPGALLVIDEFGRHLEHMVASGSDSDFHLLQNIAEATGQPDAPLSLVIVQHYGLEHYGARFSGSRRSEWEKVRGRFSEFILDNTETDAAHIMGRVLAAGGRQSRTPMPDIDKSDAGVPILHDAAFMSAARKCAPLHPITVVLLCRLARLLGQQDRTIVGWLTSSMDTGFDSTVSKRAPGWIYPEALFRHFFGDVLHLPSNPALASRFAAIVHAHERISDDLSQDARRLFETLAMLAFCTGRGLNADRQTAVAALPQGVDFDECIAQLTKRSLVIYRHYRNSYVVWKGSDYDVTGRIDEVASQMSLDFALEMTRRTATDVVAHGHLIRTGNRRTAPVLWLNDGEPAPQGTEEPRVLICIGDARTLGAQAVDVTGFTTINVIEAHVRESAAIRQLLDTDTALGGDLVAAKEMRTRFDFHESRIRAASENWLDSDLGWHVGSTAFAGLQQALSTAMDEAYPAAFNLHNELINRDRVSGQVTFALRKLIGLLYTTPELENLGISRFPAERIIYESLLKRTGLHRRRPDGQWALALENSDVPQGLDTCIREIRRLFASHEVKGGTNVETVVKQVAMPPYGLKQTPAVLMVILLLLSEQEAHELYEGGRFLPHWGPETLLRLLKAPSRFMVAGAAPSPVTNSFMRSYFAALAGQSDTQSDHTPVGVAREVLQRHAQLPPYARRTLTVSKTAQAFRRALEAAASPGDMLFRTIPAALGHSSIPQGAPARAYFADIQHIWEQLEGAVAALIGRFERVLLDAVVAQDIGEARHRCERAAKSLMTDSNMYHGHETFLSRILDDDVLDHRRWLTRVVDGGLGIATPMVSWTDDHEAQGEFLLRRNLIAMEHADRLLSTRKAHAEGPFAVFWGEGRPVRDQEGLEGLLDSMASMIDAAGGEPMSIVVDLARRFRGIE